MPLIRRLIILISISMLLPNSYKQPAYTLIKEDGRIEIRQYAEYIIAKTSAEEGNNEYDNDMFRVLAGYIFGDNVENKSIPMTIPVITTNNGLSYDMIFFMLDANSSDELPIPNDKNIKIEKMKIGKTVSITFGMWVTKERVDYYKERLEKYILANNLKIMSQLMVAQYNSPWAIPPFRKNELLYFIK